MRYADWLLSLDLSGSGPIFESECTTCGETSGAADAKEGPEIWCLRHAGRTRHTGFRAITTAFFRASLLTDGRPAPDDSAD
jgi:hypothetical protein